MPISCGLYCIQVCSSSHSTKKMHIEFLSFLLVYSMTGECLSFIPYLSRISSLTSYSDFLHPSGQKLHHIMTSLPNPTLNESREVSIKHLRRVWHANWECLSFRKSTSVPFRNLHVLKFQIWHQFSKFDFSDFQL